MVSTEIGLLCISSATKVQLQLSAPSNPQKEQKLPALFFLCNGTRPPQPCFGQGLKKELLLSIYGESRPRSKHEEKRMMVVVLLPSLKSFPAPA
jgi:hypothetical protein